MSESSGVEVVEQRGAHTNTEREYRNNNSGISQQTCTWHKTTIRERWTLMYDKQIKIR